MSGVEHTFWALCVLVPIYYLGKHIGYNNGKEEGVADAIEFFIKKKWLKEEIEKEITENEHGKSDRTE